MPKKIAVVGAGFSGAIIGRAFAEHGHHVDLFESRAHVAGNCHTERDSETGILVHQYGPHIFHTDNDNVWRFVNHFSDFLPYINRVKAVSKGRVYPLPVNLFTINQFYGKTWSPNEAREFIKSVAVNYNRDPVTFEEQALAFVGEDLYRAFFMGYTEKQWGLSPQELPASILKRLPLRFNYDDNYFNHKYQGMPRDGYSSLVEKILEVKNLTVFLGTRFSSHLHSRYDHIFYSGPIDSFFNFKFGRLGYRTLEFRMERGKGDFQGTAVINYCDPDVPFTRITEHKHFSPWESHENTIVFREYSRPCGEADIPYYPIRLVSEQKMLNAYLAAADALKNVTFVGRLGTYRYLDMDVTIAEALDLVEKLGVGLRSLTPVP